MASNSGRELPALLISRGEAEARLHKLLETTKTLLPSMNTLGAAAELSLTSWQNVCGESLRRIFSTDDYYVEFVSAKKPIHLPGDSAGILGDIHRTPRIQACLQSQAACLDSIIQRLEMIPEVSSPAASATASIGHLAFNPKDIFIIHGHDRTAKAETEAFLLKVGLNPIILMEEADGGNTVIEKLEKHRDVGFAIALMTPDDVGCKKPYQTSRARDRARQNVIGELFYFMAYLGRDRVKAFKKGDIEYPSDIAGTIATEMDDQGAWRAALVKELRNAGYKLNWP